MDREGGVHVLSNSASEESIDVPMFASQSSTIFSPKLLEPLPSPRPDIPMPSIEVPATPEPKQRTSSNDYEILPKTLSEMAFGSPPFQFGQKKDVFSFRGVYNTTPEPTARAEQTAAPNIFGSSNLGSKYNRFVSSPSASRLSFVHTSAKVVTPQVINFQTSSNSVQPFVTNQPPKPTEYNTKDETPPDEPYFNKDFQCALQAGKSIAKQIGGVLGTCELARDQESQVFSMNQMANKLSQFDAASVCTIGIVGDSGAGR